MEFQHELIIPNEGLPFKLFLFEGRNGNYVREKHWHTSIEIFTVMEGSLSFYIDEVEYPLKAGEFLIINSNEVHSIQAPFRNETIVLQIPLKQFEDYFTAQRFIRFRRADAGRNEYGYGHERNHSGNIRLNFGTMGQTEAADPSETDRKMVCTGYICCGKQAMNSAPGQYSMKFFILWFLHTGKRRWRKVS